MLSNLKSPFYNGNKFYCGRLTSGSEALVMVDFCKQNQQNLLVIADDIKNETQLLRELSFYAGDMQIMHFANYEILAYDSTSPHADIISSRIKTLSALPEAQNCIIVTTIEAALMRLCPIKFIQQNCLKLQIGQNLSTISFTETLINNGYLRVNSVQHSGEFSIKGGIVDVYPMGRKTPVRLDLFDDEIESIRTFDINTQRSIDKILDLDLLPAKEFMFDAQSRELFLQNHTTQIANNDIVYEAVENNRLPSGIEFYLPLFFEQTAALFDYLQQPTALCFQSGLSSSVDKIYSDIQSSYQKAVQNLDQIPLKIDNVFLSKEEFFTKINNFPQIVWQNLKVKKGYNFNTKILPVLHSSHDSLQKLIDFLNSTVTTKKSLIICESKSRLSVLLDLLPKDLAIKKIETFAEFLATKNKVNITIASVSRGFLNDEINIITEEDIFGNTLNLQKRRRRAKHKDFNEAVKSLIEIQENDAVVHENYGVGRYLGLITKNFDEIKNDFIHIEYAGGSKLMIPIDEINLISRYSGIGSNVPLHKLGTQIWNKAKKKAVDAMRDVASELLEIYAKREMEKGFAINKPADDYNSFVANFGFNETQDQTTTMQQVLKDMLSDKPMDRLVCGDVGFGKTEIAMRASFLAVANNSQVAILVPTTLLANQHYQSFIDRFVGFAVNIAVLSRFQTAKQQIEIKAKLKTGAIDIVIGTHKLIQKTIKYKNLGLLIIDEEHRFGVSQKEELKAMRAKCDILTMSATPIPRTLNLALGSLREMSIISTPPIGREAVKTFVSEFHFDTIKEACQRELHRGGQIFFLHNDIDSIDNMAEAIANIMPNIKIKIAHGQMPSKELKNIMADFYNQRFQILVCTTIIETGLDVPTANTIIINNAGNFGLSQLHQLRGRVGRSHHKAYAYLLVKSFKLLTKGAEKRLKVIESLEELGAGFMLANHDLEIRGAGDILGASQSGKITEIGFNLYYDLLERTINSLKNNTSIKITNNKIEVNSGISTIIPSDYIFDVSDRLSFYQRVNKCNDDHDIKDLQIEMIDRFGPMFNSCKNLFAMQSLKNFCIKVGIEKINMFEDKIIITFGLDAKIDLISIINLIQTKPQTYQLKDNITLIYAGDWVNENRIIATDKLLQSICI